MLSHITCFDMILYALNIMIALAHMLFYSLLCFLSNISAFGGYNHGHNRLTFVTDKTIKKILNNDRTEILKVELKENVERNDEASKFIWDKHIPKPLFHFIECQALMNADTETKLLLKCISNNDEEIFKFEIENKNGKLQDILFFDINGNRLNFSRRKDIGHEYFVSNREENIDSIRNSLKYMHRVKKLLPSCQVIIGKFDEFIKAVQSLRVETFKISDYDKNVVSKIWEVEKYVLRIMNTLLKTRATLSIPSLNKLEFIKSYDQFKKNMEELYDMIKTLKDTIDAEVSQHLKSGRGEKYEFQKDFDKHAEIILRDLKSVGFTSIDRKYRIFIKKLESINLLVQDIKGRNKVNSEITKDCDTKKVDKFFKKYSSCLLEYCDILDNCDEFFLNEHHYSKNSYTGSSDFTSLENAHDDILIAREMKKYLLNYQNDKTDFLIFSQTDYFKNKLSERIKINLKNTIFSIWLKHKFDRKITNDNNFKISNNDLNYIERIKILQKDLISVFNSEDSSTPQTFKKIIDSLECDQLQNDITSSRIDSDGKEQNTKHRKLEDQNQEYIQANEKSQLNEDQNQEFMQSSEESKMDETQNLNANKKDKTINENKLEENPMPLESNISKDEAKQVKSDISNGPNLQPKNSDDQEKGQESIKDIKFDDKNSKNNEKENDFTIHNDKQNIKDGSDQTTKEISSEKINESNMQINDQFMQNEAQDETLKENSDLDDSKKLINEKETKKDANPEENNKRTEENQDDESTFIDYNNIYFICGCVVVSSILGVSIFYFSSSQ